MLRYCRQKSLFGHHKTGTKNNRPPWRIKRIQDITIKHISQSVSSNWFSFCYLWKRQWSCWWQVFTRLRRWRSKSENNDSSLKDVYLIELIREKSMWGHFYCNEMGQLWLLQLELSFYWPVVFFCYGNTDLFWPK